MRYPTRWSGWRWNEFAFTGSEAEIVKLTTVDDFIQQSGIDSVSMVKIDTEGHIKQARV